MTRLLAAALLVVGAALPISSSYARGGSAQVTFDNRFGVRADLEVNGGYGCTALDGLVCTTMVSAGEITLVARPTGGGDVLFSESGWIDDGMSMTWPAWLME